MITEKKISVQKINKEIAILEAKRLLVINGYEVLDGKDISEEPGFEFSNKPKHNNFNDTVSNVKSIPAKFNVPTVIIKDLCTTSWRWGLDDRFKDRTAKKYCISLDFVVKLIVAFFYQRLIEMEKYVIGSEKPLGKVAEVLLQQLLDDGLTGSRKGHFTFPQIVKALPKALRELLGHDQGSVPIENFYSYGFILCLIGGVFIDDSEEEEREKWVWTLPAPNHIDNVFRYLTSYTLVEAKDRVEYATPHFDELNNRQRILKRIDKTMYIDIDL